MSCKLNANVSDDEKHKNDVVALTFYDGKVYSGGDDGNIKIWNEDLKLIKTIQAHPVNVYSLAILPPETVGGNATLYSSSNDGTIKSWCAETGEFKKDLINYENEVQVLFTYKNTLYAGDDKGSVGVFVDDKLKLIFNLLEEIKDLIVHDNLMFTVRDLDVIVTEFMSENSTRYMTRQTLQGKSPITLSNDKLCFMDRSGKKILCHHNNKEDKFKLLCEVDAHEMIVITLASQEGDNNSVTLASGGWDKIVKIWDVTECGKIELKGSVDFGQCINKICFGKKGQAFVGGSNGNLSRIDF